MNTHILNLALIGTLTHLVWPDVTLPAEDFWPASLLFIPYACGAVL